MIGFEKYLESLGYRPHTSKWNDKKREFDLIEGYKTPSSMANIENHWIKGDDIFTCGLHEYKKPITLINPRPNIKNINGNAYMGVFIDDDHMNKLLSQFKPEIIFNTIKENKSFVVKGDTIECEQLECPKCNNMVDYEIID